METNTRAGLKMDNILNFPKALSRSVAANDDSVVSSVERPPILNRVGRVALVIAIRLLFLVMYWLRMIVVPACGFAAVVSMIGAAVVWLFFFDTKPELFWSFAGVSFGAFVASWAYDFILMKLSPMKMFNSL